jgi:aspartyl-tRNA(Asn)/glutamyl-tRNA(Gln) amidotransferase subunit A
MAMGSDTGGSIRIPAAFCGAVGVKPTYGRVSRFGVMPLDFTLDHMGPLTRSVRDAAIVLGILAGWDPRDHTSSEAAVDEYMPGPSPSIAGVRIGVPENYYFDRCWKGIAENTLEMAKSAERLGAKLVPLRVPDIAGLNAIGRIILFVEATATMEPYLNRRADFGEDVLGLLDQGKYVPATEYVQAQRLRRVFQCEFDKLFAKVDCILTPTTPNLAPRIGETMIELGGELEDARLASTRFVRAINVLGLPAVAQPAGLVDGLPVSSQWIGKAFDEALLFRVAAALEDATGHSGLHPPGL